MRPAPSQVGQRPPADVEGEAAGGVAAHPRLSRGSEAKNCRDQVENAQVGRGRRTRRLADRRLVDLDHRAEALGAAQLLQRTRAGGGELVRRPESAANKFGARHPGFFPRDRIGKRRAEQIPAQRGFPRAAGPRDHDQAAQRQPEIEALEIAVAGALELEPTRGLRLAFLF